MGIANCFPTRQGRPTPAAAATAWNQIVGDGAGDSDWDYIDLSTGWTRANTGETISAVSVDVNKLHSFTFAEITASDESRCPMAGTTFDGDVWHKLLKLPDGYQMQSDDDWVILFEWFCSAPTANEDLCICFGVSDDPTDATLNNSRPFGAVYYTTSAGTVQYGGGGWTAGSSTTSQSIHMDRCVVSIQAAALRYGAANYNCLHSDGSNLGSGSRNMNHTVSASQDLSLVVMAGARTANETVAAGKDIKLKMRYKLIKYRNIPS